MGKLISDSVLRGYIILPGGMICKANGLLASGANLHSEITASSTLAATLGADLYQKKSSKPRIGVSEVRTLNAVLPQKTEDRQVVVLPDGISPNQDVGVANLLVVTEILAIEGDECSPRQIWICPAMVICWHDQEILGDDY